MDPIPFLSLIPQHTQVERDVLDVLGAGFKKNWFVLGEGVASFESAYAGFHDVSYCVGLGNGYDALSTALRALNIGTGDEVIVPAHTYLATWLAVTHTGAKIIPVEPDPLTLNINVEAIETSVTEQTKAILPVHLYGQPCDMSRLEEITKQYHLAMVEDNAQSHGASWKGRMTGSFGQINATSFYPTKNLGALGDGGAITTNHEDLARFARQYRNYGFSQKNQCSLLGVNSRLDELQAMVLSIKLKQLTYWNEQRRHLALRYLTLLDNVGDIRLPGTRAEAYHVYHLFVIRTTHRDKLKEYLAAFQIETAIHYPVPPHLQDAYRYLGFKKGDFPLTEEIAQTALSLPLWPGMKEEQLEFVCDRIADFFESV